MVCTAVFDAAICAIIVPPTATSAAMDSHSDDDHAKSSSETPKATVDTAIQRPSPLTPRRAARLNAPTSAPAPDAPVSRPRVRAPPFFNDTATTEIYTEY